MTSSDTNYPTGSTGFGFHRIIERSGTAMLTDMMGKDVVDLLSMHMKADNLVDDLRKVALKLVNPRTVLGDKDQRESVIDLLPKDKAEELAEKLGVMRRGNVYSILKQTKTVSDERFYQFFGANADLSDHVSVSPEQVSVESAYGLYPYQADISARAWTLLSDHPNKVVLHMPTGSGKTRTAMHIVARKLREAPNSVIVWLAASSELLEQASSEFEKCWSNLGDREVKMLRLWSDRTPDLGECEDGIVFAGLAKLHSLYSNDLQSVLALADKTSMVVFDEAHQIIAPTYRDLTSLLCSKKPGTSLCGLTATPGRTWNEIEKDEELAEFFEGQKLMLKVEGYSDPVTYLMEEGYLARPVFKSIVVDVISENDQLRVREDYSDIYLSAVANSKDRNQLIAEKLIEAVNDHKRVIFFGATVRHAELMSALLTYKGVESFVVTADTDSSDRKRNIQTYLSNNPKPMVICNYGVLTTGFDAPNTSCVVIARPTRSLVLYSQMVGRATRGPKVGGNDTADIITIVDTSLTGFGDMVEAFTNWEDIWNDNYRHV